MNYKNFYRNYKPLIMAGLTGLIIAISFPNLNLFYSAWIGLIPLLTNLSKANIRQTMFYGYFSGLIAYSILTYWIFPMIRFNTGSVFQASLCLFALSSYMAMYLSIWAVLLKYFNKFQSDFQFVLFSSCLWVSLEYLRTYLFTGLPLLLLGYSQWNFISAIQISEYTGVYGISFILVLSNLLLWKIIKGRSIKVIAQFAVMFLILIVLGKFLLSKYQNTVVGNPIRIAVIQGNIDQNKKWDTAYTNEIVEKFSMLVSEASLSRPNIIIWPETAVPGYLPVETRLRSWINILVKTTATNHIIGAPFCEGNEKYYNATILFNSEGYSACVHKKTHLIAFGEYVPLRKYLQPFFGVLNTLGDFKKGEVMTVFKTDFSIFAPTICSENFFGDTVRRFVLNGAEIIVNQTNDAWFFETSAPEQHFTMNVFRAIENRRYVVVCANTGVSGILAPSGKIIKRTDIFKTEHFEGIVENQNKITFYTKYGDIFAKICVLVVLIMIIIPLTKRKKNEIK